MNPGLVIQGTLDRKGTCKHLNHNTLDAVQYRAYIQGAYDQNVQCMSLYVLWEGGEIITRYTTQAALSLSLL